MEEKLRLKFPVVVEGKYDKAKVALVVSSPIIALDGFSVFSNDEKKQLLGRMSREGGVILLTDSDRAGSFIRSRLKSMLNGRIYNVYTPAVAGKEKRKRVASADGLLGVEGISAPVLRELLLPFATDSLPDGADITNVRFFEDGFSGGKDASERRALLARELSLPESLTSKALLEAINLLISREEYEAAVLRINNA